MKCRGLVGRSSCLLSLHEPCTNKPKTCPSPPLRWETPRLPPPIVKNSARACVRVCRTGSWWGMEYSRLLRARLRLGRNACRDRGGGQDRCGGVEAVETVRMRPALLRPPPVGPGAGAGAGTDIPRERK